jgi:small subunit ribosomal protein S8
MMTDPIADLLTRIRNANRIERPVVDIPSTKLKQRVAQVLKDEGYIFDYQVGRSEGDEFTPGDDPNNPKKILRIILKYGPEGEKVIQHIERVSKPGRRLYWKSKDLKPVFDGLGIAILSTSRGVMSDRQARAQRVGGEVLCRVW